LSAYIKVLVSQNNDNDLCVHDRSIAVDNELQSNVVSQASQSDIVPQASQSDIVSQASQSDIVPQASQSDIVSQASQSTHVNMKGDQQQFDKDSLSTNRIETATSLSNTVRNLPNGNAAFAYPFPVRRAVKTIGTGPSSTSSTQF
jgi:hypothetical protein